MAYLGKQDILGADDREYRDVAVPEWGGMVRIRSLTASEQEPWDPESPNSSSVLLSLIIVDEDGQPLFDVTDIPGLANKSAVAAVRIMRAAAEMNGATAEEIEKAVEGFDQTPEKD